MEALESLKRWEKLQRVVVVLAMLAAATAIGAVLYVAWFVPVRSGTPVAIKYAIFGGGALFILLFAVVDDLVVRPAIVSRWNRYVDDIASGKRVPLGWQELPVRSVREVGFVEFLQTLLEGKTPFVLYEESPMRVGHFAAPIVGDRGTRRTLCLYHVPHASALTPLEHVMVKLLVDAAKKGEGNSFTRVIPHPHQVLREIRPVPDEWYRHSLAPTDPAMHANVDRV